jgi:hypothetical protein
MSDEVVEEFTTRAAPVAAAAGLGIGSFLYVVFKHCFFIASSIFWPSVQTFHALKKLGEESSEDARQRRFRTRDVRMWLMYWILLVGLQVVVSFLPYFGSSPVFGVSVGLEIIFPIRWFVDFFGLDLLNEAEIIIVVFLVHPSLLGIQKLYDWWEPNEDNDVATDRSNATAQNLDSNKADDEPVRRQSSDNKWGKVRRSVELNASLTNTLNAVREKQLDDDYGRDWVNLPQDGTNSSSQSTAKDNWKTVRRSVELNSALAGTLNEVRQRALEKEYECDWKEGRPGPSENDDKDDSASESDTAGGTASFQMTLPQT